MLDKDEFGQKLVKSLSESGVETDYIKEKPGSADRNCGNLCR